MGCTIIVVGAVLIVWDLLSDPPRWWGAWAYVVFAVGIVMWLCE